VRTNKKKVVTLQTVLTRHERGNALNRQKVSPKNVPPYYGRLSGEQYHGGLKDLGRDLYPQQESMPTLCRFHSLQKEKWSKTKREIKIKVNL